MVYYIVELCTYLFLSCKSASYRHVAKISDKNHLKGFNYSNWKRNLRIVLIVERFVCVFEEDTPVILGNILKLRQ